MTIRILSNQTDTAQSEKSISTIHQAGGHLVLCKDDKRPCWLGWQKQRPSLDISIQHDGPLGIIPYSIGTSALDVDRGDWRKLPKAWANYATRRKNGRHLYYHDGEPRRNQAWESDDCSGEVRGATGYVILCRDGAERLASAIAGPRQMSPFPFPDELIQDRSEPGRLIQLPERVRNPARSLDLERIQKGARNDSLFDVVRKRAYQELTAYRKEGGDLGGWLRRVYALTDDNNRRFPVPLDRAEVRAIAYSVATWVWSRGYDHSNKKQKERQVKQVESRRAKNRERDRAIIQAASDGESASAIGRRFRVHHTTILRVLTRELARHYAS